MFSFFKDLRRFLDKHDLTWTELLSIVDQVTNIGHPPDPARNPEVFRVWVTDFLTVAAELAAFTATKWDDSMVEFLKRVVLSDDNWNLFYELFMLVYTRIDAQPVPDGLVRDTDPVKVEDVVDKVGMDIDWMKVREIVVSIIELLEMLNKERPDEC